METDLIARAEISIKAPISKVWEALVNPEIIKHYMFGATVDSQWKEGTEIIWTGEWDGKKFEDKGMILRMKPGEILQYSHYSPLSGLTDATENYHIVTTELKETKTGIIVTISQDNNPNEEVRDHNEKNWAIALDSLKKYLEQ